MTGEAARAAAKILAPCFDMFAMDVGLQCERRITQEATETIQQVIDIEKSAATAELRELLLFWGPSRDEVETWMEEEGSDYDPQMMQGMLDFIERNKR